MAGISIHALLAESDVGGAGQCCHHGPFLSTLSLRRATMRPKNRKKRHNNFYPRSPCGERHRHSELTISGLYFYPRSPCGERPNRRELLLRYQEFLSTLSLRRATTGGKIQDPGQVLISIHALLAESDHSWHSEPGWHLDFYPRSPCGERPPIL